VKPPFSPEAVVADFCSLLKSYGIRKVIGDRYAGLWPRERFEVHGIQYEPSAKRKSDLYREVPILNGSRAELLDHKKTVAQFCGLERRVAREAEIQSIMLQARMTTLPTRWPQPSPVPFCRTA
jgi:hypothetical protein